MTPLFFKLFNRQLINPVEKVGADLYFTFFLAADAGEKFSACKKEGGVDCRSFCFDDVGLYPFLSIFEAFHKFIVDELFHDTRTLAAVDIKEFP